MYRGTVSSCTVRIELATCITGGYIHFGEVTDTGNLDVIRRLNEMRSLDCPCGNETGSISRLGHKMSETEEGVVSAN
jgi:hypothetical protein